METSGIPIQDNVDAECNYDIHEKKLLGIVKAFHQWKLYTGGSPKLVRVLPYYKELVTFMTKKELSEQQAGWMQELTEYNFRIE